MRSPRERRWTDHGIEIGGRLVPLISASIQYWRHDPAHWPRLLDLALEAGFPVIETYAPWSAHELAPGTFDFGRSPNLDLSRFLRLCAERDLHVLLRPGPHINAEMTWFGFPRRIVFDPECQGRNPRGKPVILPAFPHPFPVPSYAQTKFLDETRGWFAALRRELGDLAGPDGPILAMQSDNECCFVFRAGFFDLDYSPGARQWWTSYLKQQFQEDPALLARDLGVAAGGFEDVSPPARLNPDDPASVRLALHWGRFREHYLVRSVREIRRLYEESGFTGFPWYHNIPSTEFVHPFDIPGWERDAVHALGIDLYFPTRDYPVIRRGVRALVGQSRFPHIPEHACGVWTFWQPVQPQEWLFSAQACFMHGARGLNFYMFAERDRWTGSPVSRTGEKREPWFSRLRALVRAWVEHQVHAAETRPLAGVLQQREPHQLAAAASLMEPIPNFVLKAMGYGERNFGCESLSTAAPRDHWEVPAAERAIEKALLDACIPMAWMHPALPGGPSQDLRILIVPACASMEQQTADQLRAFMERGGIVWMAPPAPRHDLKGRAIAAPWMEAGELHADGRYHPAGAGGFRIAPGAAELARPEFLAQWLADHGEKPPCKWDNRLVDVAIRGSGERRFLFAANPTGDEQMVEIRADGLTSLTPLEGGSAIAAARPGHVLLTLPPQTVLAFLMGSAP
ncbi:MAG: hypothetical protein GMKNLPBB_01262 [Myxococcota bacterium]|nr:hypothetical protein [Myxococcota bacterium]